MDCTSSKIRCSTLVGASSSSNALGSTVFGLSFDFFSPPKADVKVERPATSAAAPTSPLPIPLTMPYLTLDGIPHTHR